MAENSKISIAVIGLGAQGIVAVKNLLDEGFDVTGFEKNDFVGGIWHYSAQNRVSVLPTTVVNGSKERACFTDFPFPDTCDTYPTSKEVDRYLNDYCDHFKLWDRLRLATTVRNVHHNEVKDKWMLKIAEADSTDTQTLSFDKIVLAVSIHSIPYEPELPGREKFKGEVLHSIAFKDQSRFKGKRVLVVGASNTAADTSTSLVGIANKVYLSHRNGCKVVPRYLKTGAAIDHGFNYRIYQVLNWFERNAPKLRDRFMDFAVDRITSDEFGPLNPEWRLTPAPSLKHQVPTVSDTLVPGLRAGTIVSTAGPDRIVGDYEVGLQDGSTVQVDTTIFCTGYRSDFSVLGRYDPTLSHDATHDYYTPRMYQNILSLDYPNSLAVIGSAIVFQPAFLTSDLSTMALAQLWSTKSTSAPMPSTAEMQAWHLEHTQWMSNLRSGHHAGKSVKFSLPDGHWMDWVQATAGTNLYENLGWNSIQAWRFWWNDRKFCSLLTNGIFTAVLYRLFPSERRKQWDGARGAIEHINVLVKEDTDRRKKEAAAKAG